MGTQPYKYIVDVAANTKQFEQSMQKSTKEAVQFAGATEAVSTKGAKLGNTLGMLGGGLGKLALMVGGPVAAFSLLKGAIQSMEGPSDRFEAFVSGSKEALFEFNRALASLDFNDFFLNLVEGYEKGKELAELLDALADKAAYSDYMVSNLKAESALLGETIKNKTLDISVRADAAQKREEIEKKILLRTQDIAQRTFDIEKRGWENRNDMAADEALKLYETIDGLSSETVNRLAKAFDMQTSLFGKKKGVEMIASGEAQRGFLAGIPEETIQQYVKYFNLLETGEKDVLIKLFNTYKNIDQVRFESQRSYNLAIRETSMLLNGEDKAIQKAADSLADMKQMNSSNSGGYKNDAINTEGLKNKATKYQHVVTPEDMTRLAAYTGLTHEQINAIISENNELDKQAAIAENLTSVFEDMFMSIDGGFKAMAESLINNIQRIASQLAAKAAIFTLLKILFPGGAIASAGIGAFLGFPKFAEGGIISGPTLGLMGEYPGAKSDPEVVAPLSKLEKMIQPAEMGGEVTFRIGERELVGVLTRGNRVQRNIRGRG